MPTPSIVYTEKMGLEYGVETVNSSWDTSSLVAGDVVIFVACANTTSATFDATGWWTLRNKTLFGTRCYYLYAKVYESGATMPFTFTATTASTMSLSMVAVRGADFASRIVSSDIWQRNNQGNGSTDDRTIADTLPSVPANSLVLGFHGEATNALESVGFVPTVTGGDLVQYANNQTVYAQNIESTAITSAVQATLGDSVPQIATWYASAQNGAAIAVALPAVASGAGPTGNINTLAAGYFTDTSIHVGFAAPDFSSADSITVARDGGEEVVATFDDDVKWGVAEFNGLTAGTEYTFRVFIDGEEQIDSVLTVKTLPVGPANFVALAGSCQATASNHYVFQKMAEEEALFIGHMGDLQYENATDVATWSAATNSSMGTARMRGLLSTTPMNWQWDNHDRVMIDTLNLGTTDPATLTKWRSYAGTSGWPLTDTNARSWVAGRVLFIQTDFWTVRDDPDLVVEPRTMMGSAQKQWFKDTLESAKEPVIVWLAQWPGTIYGNGRWGSFTQETREVESWINARPGIKARMVMIGGDSHTLLADSGTRSGNGHMLNGVPNLNISGFRQSNTELGTQSPSWDIAQRTLQDDPVNESAGKYGGYSKITVEDDGQTLNFLWEGVRVDGDDGTSQVLASYTRTIETGSSVQPWENMYVGTQEAVAVYVGTEKVWEWSGGID